MSKCLCFDNFMAEQQAELLHAIDETKWYLSERQGCDVGYSYAIAHFLDEHLDNFARDFRSRFCQSKCPVRDSCDIRERIEEMRSFEEMAIAVGQ